MLTSKTTTQSIIDVIPNPIIITNGEDISMCNKNFLDFFAIDSLDDFLEKNRCICHKFEKKDKHFSLDILNNRDLWTEYVLMSEEKEKVYILNNKQKANIFHLEVEKINGNYLVVMTDITADEENKFLEKLANTDHLTQIYNRQMFDKLYLKELENLKRYGDTLSLIMIDIDRFKKVNDTYGHNVGDNVLISLTKLISKNLRTNDIFARWGGEEFIILLPRTDKATAIAKGEKLRKLIENYKEDGLPKITASFGVTEILNSDKEQCTFIRADKALYKAKTRRNALAQL